MGLARTSEHRFSSAQFEILPRNQICTIHACFPLSRRPVVLLDLAVSDETEYQSCLASPKLLCKTTPPHPKKYRKIFRKGIRKYEVGRGLAEIEAALAHFEAAFAGFFAKEATAECCETVNMSVLTIVINVVVALISALPARWSSTLCRSRMVFGGLTRQLSNLYLFSA